jgi:hypothetical protein
MPKRLAAFLGAGFMLAGAVSANACKFGPTDDACAGHEEEHEALSYEVTWCDGDVLVTQTRACDPLTGTFKLVDDPVRTPCASPLKCLTLPSQENPICAQTCVRNADCPADMFCSHFSVTSNGESTCKAGPRSTESCAPIAGESYLPCDPGFACVPVGPPASSDDGGLDGSASDDAAPRESTCQPK